MLDENLIADWLGPLYHLKSMRFATQRIRRGCREYLQLSKQVNKWAAETKKINETDIH